MQRVLVNQLPSVKNEEQMRHLIRYVNFINSRPERDLHQKGFHTHHIYPKSLAKKNNIDDFNIESKAEFESILNGVVHAS